MTHDRRIGSCDRDSEKILSLALARGGDLKVSALASGNEDGSHEEREQEVGGRSPGFCARTIAGAIASAPTNARRTNARRSTFGSLPDRCRMPHTKNLAVRMSRA